MYICVLCLVLDRFEIENKIQFQTKYYFDYFLYEKNVYRRYYFKLYYIRHYYYI